MFSAEGGRSHGTDAGQRGAERPAHQRRIHAVFRAAAAAGPAGGLSFFTVLGGVLAILGLGGFFFGSRISLSPFTAGILFLFGLFLLCYDGLVAPIFWRGAAAREYEEKEDLHTANQYVFTPDCLEVHNSRMEARLPLTMVTDWRRTGEGLWVSFGRECSALVPARLLDEGQAARITGWLGAVRPEGK